MARTWRLSDEPWADDVLRARGRAGAHAAPRVEAAPDGQTARGERGDWLSRHPREALIGGGLLALAAAVRMAGAPPVVALLAIPVGALVVAFWRGRRRPQHRPKLEVVGGCRWPLPWRWDDWREQRAIERETARLFATWDHVAEAAGIKGATLRRVVHDPEDGYAVHVTHHGKLVTHIRLPIFASAAGIPVQWLASTPDPLRPWESVIAEAPDPVVDESPDETPAWSPPPVADAEAERRARLLEVIRAEGPISGRRAAHRARLQKDAAAALVRELLDEGLVRRVDGEGLVAA